MEKVQPELKDITEAINRYAVVNDNEVSFIGSFMAFDSKKAERGEQDITKDDADRLFAYGDRETLLYQLHELMGIVLNSEEEFINW